MAQEEMAPEQEAAPAPKINFIYNSCNDLEAMRTFYSGLIGMKELSWRAGEQGWLVYDCGTIQFMIFPAGYELPVLEDWGMQPGWAGGKLEVPSWSIVVDEAEFPATVQRLIDAGVPCFSDVPQWCQDSYWSFPVRDPMGNTVEVHTIPAERPTSTDWPAELSV
jgi:catechol 2,3-dioxygenase-like lactoylglutathione lyase family enzyme